MYGTCGLGHSQVQESTALCTVLLPMVYLFGHCLRRDAAPQALFWLSDTWITLDGRRTLRSAPEPICGWSGSGSKSESVAETSHRLVQHCWSALLVHFVVGLGAIVPIHLGDADLGRRSLNIQRMFANCLPKISEFYWRIFAEHSANAILNQQRR